MKKLTEEWLKAAEDDLRVIERIGRDEHLTHMAISDFSQTECPLWAMQRNSIPLPV